MRVLSLVGPSGSGKTTIIKNISNRGLYTLMEDYLGSYPSGFSNRELLSKWMWVSRWIERIWENKVAGINYLLTDRVPLEVVPYAKGGNLLLEPIKHSIIELKDHDVHIRTLYLRLPFETLFYRCQNRLQSEPFRKAYGESDVDFALSIFKFYEDGVNNLWDITIDSSNKSVDELATEVILIMDNWKTNVS